jgi:hypothetical protein
MPESNEKGLSDLEKLLAALPPRPMSLDRVHLLFRAGQASMRRGWLWPFAALIMAVTASWLGMIVALRPVSEPVIRIVRVEVPVPVLASNGSAPRETSPPAAPSYSLEGPSPTLSYWRMQQQALRFGVEGLPEPAAESGETSEGSAGHGPDYSAGSRPRLTDHSSSFLTFGDR